MASRTLDRMKEARLAISIVSHGQTEFVEKLLVDIQSLQSEAIEIVVLTLNLDSEPIPKNFALKDGLGTKILIRNKQSKGFGENHNAAFRRVRDDHQFDGSNCLWIVLNPDIRLYERDCLTRLVDAFDVDVDLVAPAVFENDKRADSARGLYTPLAAINGFLGKARNFQNPPDWLAGMFLMVRAPTFARLGGFDERYFMYCEDVDLCLRIQLAGQRIKYVDTVRVDHEAQRDSHRSLIALCRHLHSAILLWVNPVFWQFLLRVTKR
jgi:N-acetylglucosaminyl-diphospho-decaprenol L-rhamnosyltransferase